MPETIDGPFMLELLVRFPGTFPIQVPNELVVDTYHRASGPHDFLERFYTIFEVGFCVWDLPIKNSLRDPSMRMSNKATERFEPDPEPHGTKTAHGATSNERVLNLADIDAHLARRGRDLEKTTLQLMGKIEELTREVRYLRDQTHAQTGRPRGAWNHLDIGPNVHAPRSFRAPTMCTRSGVYGFGYPSRSGA